MKPARDRKAGQGALAAGLLAMDLVHFTGLVLLLIEGAAVYLWISEHAFGPLAVRAACGLLAAMMAWIVSVMILAWLMPTLKPGRYRVMKHPMFFRWTIQLVLRRWLDIPPISTLVSQSNTLRFFVLRSFGAKVSYTANMASDAYAFDPALLTLGPGSICGAQSLVAGHLVVGEVLILQHVDIGERVLLSARAAIAPGVSIGDDTRLGFGCTLGPNVKIGKHCKIGGGTEIGPQSRLGDRVVVRDGSFIPANTILGDDARWPLQGPAL